MKLVFTNILVLFFTLEYAQTGSLETSCKRYYERKNRAEIEEFKALKKYKFLRFFPSLGYAIERKELEKVMS